MRKLLFAAGFTLIGFTAGVAAISPLDPLTAAPHIYELAFENDKVRVLRTTLRNGETPPLVAQPDRVVVYLNPCAWLVEEEDGSKRMESFKFGTPVWAPAETHGGVTSTVVQECRLVEVELKD
jgi:hypothetical protein